MKIILGSLIIIFIFMVLLWLFTSKLFETFGGFITKKISYFKEKSSEENINE